MDNKWPTQALAVGTVLALALGIATAVGVARGAARTMVARTDIHSEYVKYASGRDTITAYLAYPERADPAPAVIVIHDIYGMSDRLRPAVELLAQRGLWRSGRISCRGAAARRRSPTAPGGSSCRSTPTP
jgi:hypothetical protein